MHNYVCFNTSILEQVVSHIGGNKYIFHIWHSGLFVPLFAFPILTFLLKIYIACGLLFLKLLPCFLSHLSSWLYLPQNLTDMSQKAIALPSDPPVCVKKTFFSYLPQLRAALSNFSNEVREKILAFSPANLNVPYLHKPYKKQIH